MAISPPKVLIISYYWPPAGGPGVQRWLKFVKYLPDFGIEPVVYVPENPTYPIVDQNWIGEVAAGTVILRQKIWEPYRIASFFSEKSTLKMSAGLIAEEKKQGFFERISIWVRGNVFVPDARVLWVKPSISFLTKYISENQINTIITTGPPHSLHLIGLGLKKKLGVNWIADFRDPWTTIGYQKSLKLSRFAQQKHLRLEQQVLNAVDQIVVTSNSTKLEFLRLTNKPIEVIMNGFDPFDSGDVVLDSKFSMAHIGSLLSGRNPEFLWQILSELLLEIPGFKNHFELVLIGVVSDDVLQNLQKFELCKYVLKVGYISHNEAIEYQKKSQILLLIEINSELNRGIIPGKLFEYLAANRPIIAIGPSGSDFEKIIDTTRSGIFVDYDSKSKLKVALIHYYQLFLQGNLNVNASNLEGFTRRNLTENLSEIIKKFN